MKLYTFIAAGALSVAAFTSTWAASEGPAGNWLVEDHSAVVKISKCGSAYCGFVAKGQPGRDYRNPDPAKRNRSVIGIQVLFNMRGGNNTWSGQTYNADDGEMYSAKITLTSPSTLQIEGCSQGGVCGSQNWTRER